MGNISTQHTQGSALLKFMPALSKGLAVFSGSQRLQYLRAIFSISSCRQDNRVAPDTWGLPRNLPHLFSLLDLRSPCLILSELFFKMFRLEWHPLKNSFYLSFCSKENTLTEWLSSRQRGFGREQALTGLGRMLITINGGTYCTLECGQFCFLAIPCTCQTLIYKQGIKTD